ncbi:phage tail length tape measure family protein [Variovorax sp. HJSM1_2]|uniref:phage tail length tape measure family protein n=1 Tax=Variovorax sp. HJSM1_2 TaxID=3366263 RepID=UPI003BC96CD9
MSGGVGASTLYQIVVRMKAELGNLKPGMAEAAQAVDAGATKIEGATKRVDAASEGLGSTLEKQTGVLTSAAQATSGLSGATAFLATSLGLAAAAGVAYGVIALQVSRETERQANAITLTGNAAGLVAGQINASARNAAASINGLVGNARETMEALVATGRVGGESLESVAKGVELVTQFSGKSRDTVTADFASMGDGVAKWAAKHNEQYHYLTLDQYKYIEGLEKAGETQKAMAANSDILAQHLGGDLTKNLGTLEKAWQGVRNWASRAWDAMLDLGREDTLAQQIEAIDKQLNYLATQKTPKRGAAVQDQLRESLLARKAELQANQANEAANAFLKAQSAKLEQKAIDDYIEGQKKKTPSRAAELSDYDKLIDKLGKELPRAAAEAEGAQLGYNKAQIEFLALTKSDEWAKFTAAQRATVTALYERKAASEMVEKATKDELKTASDVAKTRQAMLDKETSSVAVWMNAQQAASEKALASVRDRANSLLDEEAAAKLAAQKNISLAQAIEEVTIARLKEKQSRFWEGSEGYQAVQQEIDARRELLTLINTKAQREESENFWKSVDQTAHDTFVNVADWGDDAFKRIGKTLQSSVLDVLYQLAKQTFVVNIGANVTGSAASAAAGGSGSSGLGSLGNVGSLLSGTGSIAAGFTGAWGAGGGILSTLNAGASLLGTGTLSGIGSGLGVMAGALGPIALGVAAVAMLAKKFTSGGGPKSEGGYNSGALLNVNNRLMGSSAGSYSYGGANDSQAQQIVESVGASYASAAAALGGKAGAYTGGAFVATDPKGKAQTQLVLDAQLNGATVYSRGAELGGVENVGRSEAELTAAVTLASSKALVKLLQNTDLDPNINGFIRSLDTASMSVAEITAALDRASAYTSFMQSVQKLPFANLKVVGMEAAEALVATAGGLDALQSKLASYEQNYYTEAERTANTTAIVTNTLNSLGLAMPDVAAKSDAARQQLRSYIEAQDLNTEAGRNTWNTLMGITDAFASITNGGKAAAEELMDSVGAVFDVLKDSVADLYGSVSSTAGMQASAGQAFIDQALSTAQKSGYLPDDATLREAIAAARSAVENGSYASAAEEQRARLLLAGKLDALLQISGKQLNAAESAAGQTLTSIPAFAGGGDHSGGLRLVGENGWEVEATGPARYWNQAQLGQAMRSGGAGSDSGLAQLMNRLIAEVSEARSESRVGTVALLDLLELWEKFDGQGLPPERATL